MKIIETERWVPSKEDPSRSEYIGQRTGQEVAYLTNISCWISGGRTDGRFPRAQISSAPPIMVRVRVFIWMCT